ncbi:Crp/Fnr family transcriptional regulator [Variovorax soli]
MPVPKRSHDSGEDAALMARALRWIEPFSHWPHARLEQVLKSARLERYRRRTQVLAHDRGRREVLAVVSGCLEVSSMSAHGRKYVNALLGPGQVAPLVRLLQDVPLPYDYHAHEDSVIIHLPSDAMLAAMDAEPILWRDVARLALKRQRLSVATLQGQMLGSVRRRLAATLLNLTEYYGRQREADLSLRLRLSQHDLAAMLGLSRQTINKELGAFVEAGVIALRYRHISVLDTEQLRQIASSD